MAQLPLTVIAGYLGAGKTTLINRLLAEDHGLRLVVLVNDFGAINIDADLLASADEDTIALTNGCVCCTMEADLYPALSAVLDRTPRPDHVIIETSGIADPAVVANAAIAEPAMQYGGTVTVVDAQNIGDLLGDPEVADQVKGQITGADLILLNKTEQIDPALTETFAAFGARAPVLPADTPVSEMIFDLVPTTGPRAAAPHPHYATWQHRSREPLNRAQLGDKLAQRPAGLYRLKGIVVTDDGPYEVHVVGQYVSARRTRTGDETRLVGLGPAARITRDEIAQWWGSA